MQAVNIIIKNHELVVNDEQKKNNFKILGVTCEVELYSTKLRSM